MPDGDDRMILGVFRDLGTQLPIILSVGRKLPECQIFKSNFMNAKDISIPVQKYFYEKGNLLQICGYSGTSFFKPDILIITKSRLAIDIEVKISRADFKADFKKEIKHLYLKDKLGRESYFYYAVPKGLVSVEEVPTYAGLIYVDGEIIEIVKKAPLLSKEKIDDSIVLSIANSLSAKCIYGQSLMNQKRIERIEKFG